VAIPDPTQAAASPTPQATAQAAPTVATPAVAGDVDVIEREWVDKANDIIKQTKDDPHKQEEAVENLQVDYLKKRYGHEVKKPDGQ
jgi:hypothetical protein